MSKLKPHHQEWLKIDWVTVLEAKLLTRLEFNQLFQIRGALNERKYYTYILWRTDLRIPIPFYVGKGVNRRSAQHTAPSENHNSRKWNILKRHKAQGLEVLTSIADTFDVEEDAFDAEAELIDLIGRKDLDAGPLANRTDGGDGTRGHLAKRGGESASARPVVIEGIPYGSLTEAEDATGLTGGALTQRIRFGWPGHFFQDEGQQPTKEGLLFRYKKRVRVPEGEYESLSAAAKATGEPFKKIYKRINYGWPGYYYTEEGQRPRVSRFKPCRVDGKDFHSHQAAAKFLNISTAAFGVRIRSTNYPDYFDTTGTIPKTARNPLNHVRTSIAGEEFDTASEAARHLGIEPGTLVAQLKSSNFPDRIGEGVTKHNRNAALAKLAVPVTIRGVSYDTLSEASQAYGIDINTLKKRCRSPSEPEYSSPDPDLAVVQPKDGRPAKIQVIVDGVVYKSVNAAFQATGIARAEIKKRIDDEAWPSFKRLYEL